jgi:hypothetical protein
MIQPDGGDRAGNRGCGGTNSAAKMPNASRSRAAQAQVTGADQVDRLHGGGADRPALRRMRAQCFCSPFRDCARRSGDRGCV